MCFDNVTIITTTDNYVKVSYLASLNGKVQGARVHFSRHNSSNSRALADRSGRT